MLETLETIARIFAGEDIDSTVPLSEQPQIKESADRLRSARQEKDQWERKLLACRDVLDPHRRNNLSRTVTPEEYFQAQQDIGEAEREHARCMTEYLAAQKEHHRLTQHIREAIIQRRQAGLKAAVLRLDETLAAVQDANASLLAYQSGTEALVETAVPKDVHWAEFSVNPSGECRYDHWRRIMKALGLL